MAKLNNFGSLITKEYKEYNELDKDQQAEYKKNTRRKQLLTSLNIRNLQTKGIITKEQGENLIEDIRNRILIESSAIDVDGDELNVMRMCAKNFVYNICENFTNQEKQKGEIKKYATIVSERMAYHSGVDQEEQNGMMLAVKAYVKHIKAHEQL